MRKYIQMFVDSAPLLIIKIQNDLAHKDYTDLANQVGGYASKWIMMGMRDAKSLSLKIETECRSGKVNNGTMEDIQKLVNHVEVALNELERILIQRNQ